MKLLKPAIAACALVITAFFTFQNSYAEAEDPNVPKKVESAAQDTVKSKSKLGIVKTIDFYLRNGNFVSGKLLEEDQSKIVIEQVNQSDVVVMTYPKKEVDPRTIHTNTVAEYKYYLELGDYFAGKTWDFRDDADDFIQAIRCYETARRSLVASSLQDDEKIGQIEKAIAKINADREVWTREMESRARLKKLEFDAEFEKRMNELAEKVKAAGTLIAERTEKVDKILAQIQDQQQKNTEDIASMKLKISNEFDQIYEKIKTNRRMIDQLSFDLYAHISNRQPPHKKPDPLAGN